MLLFLAILKWFGAENMKFGAGISWDRFGYWYVKLLIMLTCCCIYSIEIDGCSAKKSNII